MLANWRSSPFLALAALVGITAVWGYTFLIVQSAVEVMPVMDFMAWRFAAAALLMLALRPEASPCHRTSKSGQPSASRRYSQPPLPL